MLGAEFMWGVSAPLGKVILAGGVTPLMLTDCRMVGAAALFLVLFKRLTSRYSPVTLMKWMFTYASVCVIPFSYNEWACAGLGDVWSDAWWGVAAFVVGPTFVSYLLLPVGQRFLRPTVTAMYNYVQPIVATLAAVWMGVGGFSVLKGVAVVLVFCGVGMVARSKSREDMERVGRGDG